MRPALFWGITQHVVEIMQKQTQ